MLIRHVSRRSPVRPDRLLALLFLLAAFAPLAAFAQEGATLSVSVTEGGVPTLVAPDGRTLYWFAHDHEGEPTCYDQCAVEWPPLTVEAGVVPSVGDGVLGPVGTVEREDGTLQVTYNGWPQYFYYEDTAPGQANGQGLGDVWFATAPATVMLSNLNADGDYLVGPGGFTLYVFAEDEESESYCFGECLVAWPALIVPEGMEPLAGPGVTGSLGTIEHDNGSRQVTYDGSPLYFFRGDLEPGDRNGHGLKDVWFTADPAELAGRQTGGEEGEGGEAAEAEAGSAATAEPGADTTEQAGAQGNDDTGAGTMEQLGAEGNDEPAAPAATQEAAS